MKVGAASAPVARVRSPNDVNSPEHLAIGSQGNLPDAIHGEDELMPFRRRKTERITQTDDQMKAAMCEVPQLLKRPSVACMEQYLDDQHKCIANQPEAVKRENIKVGLLVVRGPDWRWGDEDGGSGQIGTVQSFKSDVGMADVLWQSGASFNHYQYLKSTDLAIAPEVSTPVNFISKLRNSQAHFNDPTQTFIVLDWDDTLFPTTYVRDDLELCWKKPLKDQRLDKKEREEVRRNLEKCASNVCVLLKKAASRGKVVLVTLAKPPWVTESCKNFYPAVGELIAKLQVPIIYAQEMGNQQEYSRIRNNTAAAQEVYWSRVKGKAIAAELRAFYSQYEGQSWKNVISIGDSEFERLGTQYAVQGYKKATGIIGDVSEPVEVGGHIYKIRAKTFKMVDTPTVDELIVELIMIQKWFPYMVNLDSGFDINLNTVGDADALNNIEQELRQKPQQKNTGMNPVHFATSM